MKSVGIANQMVPGYFFSVNRTGYSAAFKSVNSQQ